MQSVIRVRASHSRSKTLREPDRVALPTAVVRLIILDLVFFSQRHLTFEKGLVNCRTTWQYQCTFVNKLEALLLLSAPRLRFSFGVETDNNAQGRR